MFDIGFAEILLIAVVSLIVIGPKRLPETVRFIGFWLGKIKRSVHSARQEMEREFGLDEVRREIYNQELLARLEEERQQVAEKLGAKGESGASPDTAVMSASQQITDDTDWIDEDEDEDAVIKASIKAASKEANKTERGDTAPVPDSDGKA